MKSQPSLPPAEANDAEMQGELVVGCFASICRNYLGDELLTFVHDFPDIELRFHEMPRSALLTALRNGELSLAIMPGSEPTDLEVLELWQDQVMVALPHAHPLAFSAAITPEQLENEIFLVSRHLLGGDMHRFLALRILPEQARPNIALVDFGQNLLDEVAAGKGISLVCSSHDEHGGAAIVRRPIDATNARFSVCAYWNAGSRDPVLAKAIAILAAENPRRTA